jgi:ATP-dependent RNA helicase DHX29
MSLLVEDWVSKAAAMQRRGRAGRVRAGTCYCCYTKQRFDASMRQYAVPEVARVPLEELVLQVKIATSSILWQHTTSARVAPVF